MYLQCDLSSFLIPSFLLLSLKLSYADRLQSLNLYSVQGRLIHADLIQCWKLFNGKLCLSPDDMFDRPPQERTRGLRFRIFPTHTHTTPTPENVFSLSGASLYGTHCLRKWSVHPTWLALRKWLRYMLVIACLYVIEDRQCWFCR